MEKLIDFGELVKFKNTKPTKKFVFTSGVFSCASHNGHPRYLKKAKGMGDYLVVGIHSDELVEKRKGTKPVFSTVDRIEFVSYWPFVDFLLEIPTQEDIYSAIKILRPHIVVVSETTTDEENCPEAMLVKFSGIAHVEILPAQSSYHSSDLIRRNNHL